MSLCHFCNNQGKEGGCPKCGLTPRKSVHTKMLTLDVPTEIIPVPYQGVMWEKPTQEDIPLKFKQFDEALERVYTKFLKGQIPTFSMFIGAPPKSGKNLFAYSCMQTALTQKFTVAPLLSTADWRRLYSISQANPFYKLYGKYKWDDLLALDVVFLYVDYSDDRRDDIPLLKNIYDARAQFNLPTFVLSDFRLNDLVPKWGDKTYAMIHNPDETRNYLRYPVIIHRFE